MNSILNVGVDTVFSCYQQIIFTLLALGVAPAPFSADALAVVCEHHDVILSKIGAPIVRKLLYAAACSGRLVAIGLLFSEDVGEHADSAGWKGVGQLVVDDLPWVGVVASASQQAHERERPLHLARK